MRSAILVIALLACPGWLMAQYTPPSGGGGAPSGSAGGDLTGTYPNPSVKGINGTVLSSLSTCVLKVTTGTGAVSCLGTVDANNNLLLPAGAQIGTASSATGYWLWNGTTSGSKGFTVPDAAGTSALVVLPTNTITPSAGQVFAATGTNTCPAGLPAGAPANCIQTSWQTQSGGGGGGASSGAFSGLPATCTQSDIYYTTDSVYSFVCTATNTWSAWFGTYATGVPPSTGWSTVNPGSATFAQSGGVRSINSPGATGVNLHLEARTLPACPYTITAIMTASSTSFANVHRAILGLRDGTGGGIVSIDEAMGGSISTIKWTSATAFSASYALNQIGGRWAGSKLIFLRVADNCTNRIFSYSPDGVSWLAITTVLNNDFIAPTQAVWGVDDENTETSYLTLIGWLVQ